MLLKKKDNGGLNLLGIFGQISLVISFIFAIFAIISPLFKKNDKMIGNMIIGQTLFAFSAFVILIYAFVVSDFSISNVYQNSHTTKPLIYKIAGSWGSHEGSMLLWANLHMFISLAYLIFSDEKLKIRLKILTIQSWLSVFILGFIIFTSNPFVILDMVPENGKGLNPLLQDIGLAIHPPILYLGYVSSSIAFSSIFIYLLQNEFSSLSAFYLQKWILFSWSFLTLGIGLGSLWAYRELGWGGFWFWDPVENASLMPWLLASALLHANIVCYKTENLKNWTSLLAILTFLASILGAFLVRSGIITSVHSFASDPGRGVYILAALCFASLVSLSLFAFKPFANNQKEEEAFLTKQNGIKLNNLLLFTLFFTICLGTIYPIFYEIIMHKSISVGEPYFVKVFLPIAISLLFASGFFSNLNWKRSKISKIYFLILLISGLFLLFIHKFYFYKNITSSFALFGSFYLLFSMFYIYFKKLDLACYEFTYILAKIRSLSVSFNTMILSHIGFAILAIGITFSSGWDAEKTAIISIGEKIRLDNYEVELRSLNLKKKHNYVAAIANLYVEKKSNELGHLWPEQRFYNAEQTWTSESSIIWQINEDFYVNISEIIPSSNKLEVKLFIKPFVSFIWMGVLILFIGGIYSSFRKRNL